MPTVARKRKRTVAIPSPDEIRAIREKLSLSIEEAAERVGVTPRAWYSWELPSQKREPSKSHAILIRMLADL